MGLLEGEDVLRTAAAMRATEGFVWVVMHHVGAKISWAGDAENGVHIGAIEVDQSTDLMQHGGNSSDIRFK